MSADQDRVKQIVATMTREQTVLVVSVYKLYQDARDEQDRLRRLAFGAGMALAGIVPDREHGADLLMAQDLIAQMLEETS